VSIKLVSARALSHYLPPHPCPLHFELPHLNFTDSYINNNKMKYNSSEAVHCIFIGAPCITDCLLVSIKLYVHQTWKRQGLSRCSWWAWHCWLVETQFVLHRHFLQFAAVPALSPHQMHWMAFRLSVDICGISRRHPEHTDDNEIIKLPQWN